MTNIEAILIGLLSVAHTPEQAKHAARTVLRDHAHQLAESQRAALERGPGATWDYETGRALADLIDPEVQR
ncbi:hypothetical protein [Streptomyces sp. NPDC057336]|uniref:hypothetical protein n=1 Tax=Streptomyces sp. NPDC057336 TaxID=3346102 RepID=UPI00362EBF6A